jgi:hypothetical protein
MSGGKVETDSLVDALVEVTEVELGAGRAEGSWLYFDRCPKTNVGSDERRSGVRIDCRTNILRTSSLVSAFSWWRWSRRTRCKRGLTTTDV